MFENLIAPAPDKIIQVMQAFAADTRANKIDLGVGVYRTAGGLTPVFRAVKSAETTLVETQQSKGYISLAGDPEFHAAGRDLALAGCVDDSRIAALATPGGTGAVRQAFELARMTRPDATIWVSNPTWPNHEAILDTLGMNWRQYRYYDPSSAGLDRSGMQEDLAQVASGDVILLHGCCHNPTGADLDGDDWRFIGQLVNRTGAVPMIDLAYQGFGDGVEQDVAGMRELVAMVPEALITTSASKNFGLYRDRVGLVLAICPNAQIKATVRDTLAWLNRQSCAFPPDHGARVVTEILNNPDLRAEWEAELAEMRARVQSMRKLLAQTLRAATGSDQFGFLQSHRGMFSRLGATPEQVEELRRDHAVYMVGDSRINLAGLTEESAEKAASAIAAVMR